MQKSSLPTSLAICLGLALTACGQDASAPGSTDETPPPAAAPDFGSAVWMEADAARDSLLVLLHGTAGGATISRLLVLNPDGGLRKSLDLSQAGLSFEWPQPQVHYFPALGRLVVTSLRDAEAWAVDLESGSLQKWSTTFSCAASDPDHNRLFLVEDRLLRVIDAASGQTVASHQFEVQPPSAMQVGTDGSLSFVIENARGGGGTLVHFVPPTFAVRQESVVSDRSVTVQAFDDRRGRAFLQFWDPYQASLFVEQPGQGGPRRMHEDIGQDLVYPRLVGLWADSPWIYVQNDMGALPPSELQPEMLIYDAESLKLIRRIPGGLQEGDDDLKRDSDGSLLVLRNGERLERWQPTTLQVTAGTGFDGVAGLWTLDRTHRRAYAMVFGGVSAETSQLVRLDLDTLQRLE